MTRTFILRQFLALTIVFLAFINSHNHNNNTLRKTFPLVRYPSSHPATTLINCALSSMHRKNGNIVRPVFKGMTALNLCAFALMLSGDIELIPGPAGNGNANIFPCGYCEYPVTWSHVRAIACDQCNKWYHSQCIESSAGEKISLLQHDSVSWTCVKCHSINVDSFSYHSFELETSNQFSVLSNVSTLPSIDSSFSPGAFSSPKLSRMPSFTSNNETSSLKNPPKRNKNLRVLIMNCQSIRNKRTQLAESCEYLKPDIIIGSESWLEKDIKTPEIFPDQYQTNVYRKDRNKNGGGVFIAAKENFSSWTIDNSDTDCEIIWTEIQTSLKNIVIGSFYRPPSSTIEALEHLNDSITNIKEKCKDKIIILAGDFNLPHIDWNTLAVKSGCNQSNQHHFILDISEEHGLEQIQLNNTRQEHNLDLYFTSHPSLVKNCETIPGISDHDMIIVDSDIKPKYNKPKRRKIYQYKKANWESVKDKMRAMASDVCSLSSVEGCWERLKSGIDSILESDIPSKMSSNRHNHPWITPKLKKKIKQKHKLYQKAKVSKDKDDWDKYKACKSSVQKELRGAHWNYVNESLAKNMEQGNNKAFWKYIKSKRNDNVGVAGIKQNGVLHHDSQTKAEILNNQFHSVFTKENVKAEKPKLNEKRYPSINNLLIDINGVEKLLSRLNVNKASGPDSIPNRILKNCSKELAPAIAHIFQISLTSGQLPSDWKNANVSPIFKKGSRHEPSNYRPVSLTSVCCKTLEHILVHHILKHLEKYNILTSLQHGFRSGHSCESQLILTMDDIMKQVDGKKQIDMVILDFSKAFDTVPHHKLLYKLDNYGIRGEILSWISAFLLNREQRVIVEGESSSSCRVESGVPQGTVLGPLLFLLHINDLPRSVKSQVRLFADDCLLYRAITSFQDHLSLQKDLDSLKQWADDWGMRFNETKCYLMSIHRSKTPSTYNYILNDHILKQVSNNPYLGVQISDDLKWSTHINKVCSRASSILGFIKRNLRHSSKNFKEQAYISLVRSILDYASSVWDPHLQKDIDRLEGVQRRGARFVCNDYGRRSSVTTMMRDLGWKPLRDRRRDQRLSLFHKIVNDLVAIPSAQMIEFNNRKQRHGNSKSVKLLSCNTDVYKYSFIPQTIRDWNTLPDAVVNYESNDSFRTALSKLEY